MTGTIVLADAREYLATLPDKSFDVVFLDPPYNIDKKTGVIQRPEGGTYQGVTEKWDRLRDDTQDHLDFITWYVLEAQRIAKQSFWIMGQYHNIHHAGSILLQNGGFILNDIVWVKSNPAPHFRGVRFNNSIEFIIWAKPSRDAKYYFDYKAMKEYNGGKQMRADWRIPLCRGKERIKVPDPERKSGFRPLHQTQKPLDLMKRVVLSSVPPDGTILDFMAGVGTTGAAAEFYDREYCLVEQEDHYFHAIRERLPNAVPVLKNKSDAYMPCIFEK